MYNPGITYHGDQYLAQGISAAGQAIAEGIDQAKKNREEAKGADAALPTYLKLLGQAGISPSPEDLGKFTKGGVSTKKGMLGAWSIALSNEAERRKTALAEQQAQASAEQSLQRAAAYKALADDRAQRSAQDAAASEAWGKLAAGNDGPEAMTPDELQNRAWTVLTEFGPKMGPENSAKLMASLGALRKTDAKSNPTASPQPYHSPNGNDFIWHGGTLIPDPKRDRVLPENWEYDPNGKAVRKPTQKEVAPNYSWLMTDDLEELKNGLATLEPKARDAAMSARAAFNRAVGKPDMAEQLKRTLEGKDAAKSKAPPMQEGPWTQPPKGRFDPEAGAIVWK